LPKGHDGHSARQSREKNEARLYRSEQPQCEAGRRDASQLSIRQSIGTGDLIGLDAADFVLLDAGPLEDISNTRRIHAVFSAVNTSQATNSHDEGTLEIHNVTPGYPEQPILVYLRDERTKPRSRT
jgi:hypothetical protein